VSEQAAPWAKNPEPGATTPKGTNPLISPGAADTGAEPMVTIDNVSKIFGKGKKEVAAVKNVSLTVKKGEIFAIIGYSGAGKSTLVRLINGLESTTSGTLTVDGFEISGKRDLELQKVRTNIGMIFQQFNLMNSRTVAQNVEFPLKVAGWSKGERTKRVQEMLEFVGLADRAKYYPSQLSGGQKQRVGIARALATKPSLLLADEATSALDPETTHEVLELLKEASSHPKVKEIRISIYRLSNHPRIYEYLIKAAHNGKCVKVLIELRARFDESSNINWAKRLEEAGCHVYYGTKSYKSHFKTCQVIFRKSFNKSGANEIITQVGTGNYNESTAKQYTDFSVITANHLLGLEVMRLFDDAVRGIIDDSFQCILASPGSLRKGIVKLIDREIEKGSAGRIFIKVNSVTDRAIIEKLADNYETIICRESKKAMYQNFIHQNYQSDYQARQRRNIH